MSVWLPEGSPLQGRSTAKPAGPVLFLDRDGVIIVDADYIGDPLDVELIPGAAAALVRARDAGYGLACLTNQSGIGRGYYSREDFGAVQARIDELLRERGVILDIVCYCPHSPDEGCACRKPATGLLEEAAGWMGWDGAASAMVGDKISDVDLALAAGLRPLLTLTGKGSDQAAMLEGRAGVDVVADLGAAVDLLLGEGER